MNKIKLVFSKIVEWLGIVKRKLLPTWLFIRALSRFIWVDIKDCYLRIPKLVKENKRNTILIAVGFVVGILGYIFPISNRMARFPFFSMLIVMDAYVGMVCLYMVVWLSYLQVRVVAASEITRDTLHLRGAFSGNSFVHTPISEKTPKNTTAKKITNNRRVRR